ncbi:MAG TPA: hypothetical protein VGR66_00465, partial [Candidatus Eisenbacteria bacterium]|nr:hypothetical protein [Candidatus Eisenbacteria bacterium]
GHWIGYVAGEQQGRWTANHEFVHTVAAELFQNVPTCLNEGFAEFYSTSSVGPRGIRYGDPIPWHLETLGTGDLFTLDQLFGKGARDLAYAGGRSSTLFYAESWILVHYLMHEDGGAPRLRRLAEAVAGGTPAREAMAKIYPGESWEGLPARLRTYAAVDERDFPTFEIPLAGAAGEIAVSMRAADPAEIAVHTGLWRMQPAGSDADVTRSLFEQARQDSKTAALAADGFGLLALQGSQAAEAEKQFRHAASDPHADPLALAIAGAGLLQVAGQKTEGRQERIDEALAILERAIERDSLDAHALAWYGEGAVLGGRYTPAALRALEQASRSLRGDPQLAKALDLARKSNALASRGVPTGQAAVDSLNARAESGRYEEALQLLDDMEGATTDEAVKKSIRENREQVERMRDHNRAVDDYNRGLAALQKEDFVSAARAFDAAREGARDSTLRANAVERLDEIPSYEAFQGGLAAAKKGNWTAALSAFEHARKLAKSDELRHMCDQNIAHIRAMNAKRVPAH